MLDFNETCKDRLRIKKNIRKIFDIRSPVFWSFFTITVQKINRISMKLSGDVDIYIVSVPIAGQLLHTLQSKWLKDANQIKSFYFTMGHNSAIYFKLEMVLKSLPFQKCNLFNYFSFKLHFIILNWYLFVQLEMLLWLLH